MKKGNKHWICITVLLAGCFLIPGCDKLHSFPGDEGILEGVISIGPICPVETNPPAPACLPTAETYKAYPVTIWTANGKKKIVQLNPALDGSYSISIAPGNYLVVLEGARNKTGSSNLPVTVSIQSKDFTILDINIDTGIR